MRQSLHALERHQNNKVLSTQELKATEDKAKWVYTTCLPAEATAKLTNTSSIVQKYWHIALNYVHKALSIDLFPTDFLSSYLHTPHKRSQATTSNVTLTHHTMYKADIFQTSSANLYKTYRQAFTVPAHNPAVAPQCLF